MKRPVSISSLSAFKARQTVAELVPSEHAEQCALIEWFDLQYPALRGRLASVPNAGKMPPQVGRKMNLEGRRKGYPDLQLLVPHAGFHGLIVEMKRISGGRIEPEQLEWLEWFAEMGYRSVVCKGFEAAKSVIVGYLHGYKRKV